MQGMDQLAGAVVTEDSDRPSASRGLELPPLQETWSVLFFLLQIHSV